MQETEIVQGEYKYLKIFINNRFHEAARVNRATLFESLYKIRITATLEGHKIIDTGIKDRIENLTYEIQEVLSWILPRKLNN